MSLFAYFDILLCVFSDGTVKTSEERKKGVRHKIVIGPFSL